ncbi:MAG: cytochrome c [Anaerolineales bacterium]|nr:cytochrome c [Anaerolineales bacterium]
MQRFVFVIAIVFVFILASCTGMDNAKKLASYMPASVESQLTNGERIYAQTCATSTCHGTQGEGIRSETGFSAWPLVGADFQSRHPNAQIVFDVIRSGGEPNLRALSDQQIYDSIAYELSQNQITLASPLTSANAFTTYGAAMSGQSQGGLFPPSNNAALINMPFKLNLPIAAKNEGLQLQLDQIAQASAIGNAKPPAGGAFLILVIVFNDLSTEPITVSPDHLRLSTAGGDLLEPQSINLHSAIEKFHTQTIKLYYGTSALVVFTLSAPEQFDQLIYDDQAGNRLTLALKP